jgi:hypothetical protein
MEDAKGVTLIGRREKTKRSRRGRGKETGEARSEQWMEMSRVGSQSDNGKPGPGGNAANLLLQGLFVCCFCCCCCCYRVLLSTDGSHLIHSPCNIHT